MSWKTDHTHYTSVTGEDVDTTRRCKYVFLEVTLFLDDINRGSMVMQDADRRCKIYTSQRGAVLESYGAKYRPKSPFRM